MISVTMDLMDMSELPDLSSSAQVTDISTFSAQPPPTGEYYVYTFFVVCYGILFCKSNKFA